MLGSPPFPPPTMGSAPEVSPAAMVMGDAAPHSASPWHSVKAPDVPIEPREVALMGATSALRHALSPSANPRALFPLDALSFLKSCIWGAEGMGGGGRMVRRRQNAASLASGQYNVSPISEPCAVLRAHPCGPQPSRCRPPSRAQAAALGSGGTPARRRGFHREPQGRTRGWASCLASQTKGQVI